MRYCELLDEPLIKYEHTFDVVELFKPYNISTVFEHIVGKFFNKFLKNFNEQGDYIQEIVQNKEHNVLHIDYNFLIDCMGDLVKSKEKFMSDFSHDGLMQNRIFLIHGLLESYLHLVKLNTITRPTYGKKTIQVHINYFAPIIVKTDNGVHAQMSAVVFNKEKFEELIRPEYKDYMKVLDDEYTVQVNGYYGATQCNQFWKESDNKLTYVGNIV